MPQHYVAKAAFTYRNSDDKPLVIRQGLRPRANCRGSSVVAAELPIWRSLGGDWELAWRSIEATREFPSLAASSGVTDAVQVMV
jgi:hypothetical protein